MNYIVHTLLAIYEVIFFAYLPFSVLKRRYSVKVSALIYIVYTIIQISKHLLLYSQMQIRSLISFSITLIVLCVLFSDSILKKLACFATYMISAMLSETIVMTICKLAFNIDPPSLELGAWSEIVYTIAIYVIWFPLLIVAKHLLSKQKNISWNKVTAYLMLYGIVQCGLVYILFLIIIDYKIRSIVVLLSMSFVIIVSMVIAFLLYKQLKKSVRSETRAEQMEIQLKMQQEHFRQLEQQYAEYKRLRHDYKNHIRILQNINDADKMQEYLGLLTEKIDKYANVTFCNNAALDALLFIQYNSALQKGIKSEFLICDLEGCGVSDIDLCTVLSNLTDNAIRAALEVESEKFMRVCVTKRLNKLIISVSNSGNKPLSDYKTTKKDTVEHGLGLDIVKKTAKEYNGSVVLNYEDGVFSASVVLDESAKGCINAEALALS